MEVRRQERRGLASRSTRDVSNKENICPSVASVVAVEMMGSRRSPLPAGFPRSSLQDITHIICPPNILLDGDDPFTGQVHKKAKKENSVGVHAQNDNENSTSWKGLTACIQLRIPVEEAQVEEITVDKVAVEPIRLERCTDASPIDAAFSIHRDVTVSSASNPSICAKVAMSRENEGICIERGRIVAQAHSPEHAENERVIVVEQGAQNKGKTAEKCIERRRISSQAQLLEQREHGKAEERQLARVHSLEHSGNDKDGDAEKWENDKVRCMGKLVVKEVHYKRVSKQDAQVKKRSTLSMLR